MGVTAVSEFRFDELKNLEIPSSWTEKALRIPKQRPKERNRFFPRFFAAGFAASLAALLVSLSVISVWRHDASLPTVTQPEQTRALSVETTVPRTGEDAAERKEEIVQPVTRDLTEAGFSFVSPYETEAGVSELTAEPTEKALQETTARKSVVPGTASQTVTLSEPQTVPLTVCISGQEIPTGPTETKEPAEPQIFYGRISHTFLVDGERHQKEEAVYCKILDENNDMAGGASEDGCSAQHLTQLQSLSPDLPDAVCVMRSSYTPSEMGVTVMTGLYRVVFYYRGGEVLSDYIYELGTVGARPVRERW